MVLVNQEIEVYNNNWNARSNNQISLEFIIVLMILLNMVVYQNGKISIWIDNE